MVDAGLRNLAGRETQSVDGMPERQVGHWTLRTEANGEGRDCSVEQVDFKTADILVRCLYGRELDLVQKCAPQRASVRDGRILPGCIFPTDNGSGVAVRRWQSRHFDHRPNGGLWPCLWPILPCGLFWEFLPFIPRRRSGSDNILNCWRCGRLKLLPYSGCLLAWV